MKRDFNTRLADLADQVRALNDGEEIARALLRLAADMDGYLAGQQDAYFAKRMGLFQKWNDFLNESVADTQRYHEGRDRTLRRQLARAVAADPRWQGGYADALKLLQEYEQAGEP